MYTRRFLRALPSCVWALALTLTTAATVTAQTSPDPAASDQSGADVFRLGEIVNVGAPDPGGPGVGGALITNEQTWTFGRTSLEQAVNLLPGVSSTLDTNGRRNETDISVRGFGRWQVPLMMDGVRIYLPADNRLDFARFLTADIAAIQIQKGYASVLDGPGAMGGAINLVTSRPTAPFHAEGGISGGGRSSFEGSNGYFLVGTRRPKYYLQANAAYSKLDHWTLSSNYQPPVNTLQPAGDRLDSDSRDWSLNVKAGFTPNATNEYTLNVMKQSGEKGAPLNVYNNPPVPPNSYWRWPYWDVQNISFLTHTQLGSSSYLKTRLYANTFKNGLNAYDDGTYTTQSLNGRFSSPYDDKAYGGGAELGTTPMAADTIKVSFYYRTDIHNEAQTSRPTSPTFVTTEPNQRQAQNTWSIAAENTLRMTKSVDLVAGVSYEKYDVTEAQEYNTTRGLFEYPKGGADAFNGQAALIWHYSEAGQFHASISDRARFPVIFELYSTRFGTATPNPNLGPERAANAEFGWKGTAAQHTKLEATVFYSDVRDLIQTAVLPDTTTQTQNVGTGTFYGAEVAASTKAFARLDVGANYSLVHRTITDGLQPNLRPVGVPTHKAFLYATWNVTSRLRATPSLDLAGDRWSDVTTTPVTAFPYTRTGAYKLLNLDATAVVVKGLEVSAGFKNLLDENYELAWGFPMQGRSFFVRSRVKF